MSNLVISLELLSPMIVGLGCTTLTSGDFDVADADGSTNNMPLVTVEISKLLVVPYQLQTELLASN